MKKFYIFLLLLIYQYSFAQSSGPPSSNKLFTLNLQQSNGLHKALNDWYENFSFSNKTKLTAIADNSDNGRLLYGTSLSVNPMGYIGNANYGYVKNMYKFDHTDWNIHFLTNITEKFAVTWGFGTGANSQKMTVSPSQRLGLIHIFGVDENKHPVFGTNELSYFTLSAHHTFGGGLSEQGCTDDYNRLYNCRTAMSVVDTPLMNRPAFNAQMVNLKYTWIADFF